MKGKHNGSSELKKLVEKKLLKNNEEIYFRYKGILFFGRIVENGEKIEVDGKEFRAISKSILYCIDKINSGSRSTACGWKQWENWKGISLDTLRKQLKND